LGLSFHKNNANDLSYVIKRMWSRQIDNDCEITVVMLIIIISSRGYTASSGASNNCPAKRDDVSLLAIPLTDLTRLNHLTEPLANGRKTDLHRLHSNGSWIARLNWQR